MRGIREGLTAHQVVFQQLGHQVSWDGASGGSNQSGSGDRSRSPSRVKQRMGPPSTPVKGDLRAYLTERQRQTSQAKSWGSNSWDRGGVGHSGSHQSPSLHTRTSQGPSMSSSTIGPPRPPPGATVTSRAPEVTVALGGGLRHLPLPLCLMGPKVPLDGSAERARPWLHPGRGA